MFSKNKKDIGDSSILRQKFLYFDCHSGRDPESSVLPLGQRPFWTGGNLDSRWSLPPYLIWGGNDGFATYVKKRWTHYTIWERLQRGTIAALTSKRGLSASFMSLLLVVILGLPTYTLNIKEATESCEMAAIQVSQGDLLRVEYVHSIYKVKQSEVFSIGHDSRFYLEKVTFGSYAAAAYYDPDPPQGLVFKDGLWMVKGNGKNYSVLKYRVGPGTDHVLTLRNLTLDLSSNTKVPGGLIEVCLEREEKN